MVFKRDEVTIKQDKKIYIIVFRFVHSFIHSENLYSTPLPRQPTQRCSQINSRDKEQFSCACERRIQSLAKRTCKSEGRLLNNMMTDHSGRFRNSARAGHIMRWTQIFCQGKQFSMFPSISCLFLCWRRGQSLQPNWMGPWPDFPTWIRLCIVESKTSSNTRIQDSWIHQLNLGESNAGDIVSVIFHGKVPLL